MRRLGTRIWTRVERRASGMDVRTVILYWFLLDILDFLLMCAKMVFECVRFASASAA